MKLISNLRDGGDAESMEEEYKDLTVETYLSGIEALQNLKNSKEADCKKQVQESKILIIKSEIEDIKNNITELCNRAAQTLEPLQKKREADFENLAAPLIKNYQEKVLPLAKNDVRAFVTQKRSHDTKLKELRNTSAAGQAAKEIEDAIGIFLTTAQDLREEGFGEEMSEFTKDEISGLVDIFGETKTE